MDTDAIEDHQEHSEKIKIKTSLSSCCFVINMSQRFFALKISCQKFKDFTCNLIARGAAIGNPFFAKCNL